MNEEVLVPEVAPPRQYYATPAQRAEWVRRFGESGLSIREFSQRHGLALSTIQRWVASSRTSASAVAAPPRSEPVAFTEVKVSALAAGPNWAAELCRPNGSILRLTRELSPALLEQLLRVC